MRNTFAPSSPFYDTADAGAGGGSGGGQMPASGGQGQGGGQGAGAGGGTGGGGGATPITLTPDSMVIPPGSTTPIKYSDYQQQYIPRTELATHQQSAVATFLKNLVAAKNRQPQQQPRQQPGARTERVDPLAEYRTLPLVDGASLTSALERMQSEGVGPLYEWATKANQVIEALSKKVSLTEKATGSLAEERSAAEFSGKMKTAALQLAKDMLPGIKLEDHPVIEDFVQDVYLSYDPRDPKLEQEFPSLLKSRLDGVFKLANALNQAKLQQARDQRRSFLKPGGQPKQPNGQPAERLSHAQIARNLFTNDASAT